MLENFITQLETFAFNLGPLGIFLGMFLESSIIPIPSEAILITAGVLGYSPIVVAIFGGLGSTFGSIIGYGIGIYGGRPFLNRFGKYFFITFDRLKMLDNWFVRWGNYAVLIGRLIPFIPYKVFSIGSGIGKMNFKYFLLFTLIGSIPRALLLSYFGNKLVKIGNIYVIITTLIIIALIPLIIDKFLKNSPGQIRTGVKRSRAL